MAAPAANASAESKHPARLALLYLWRRGVIVVWLGDGLSRFVSRL